MNLALYVNSEGYQAGWQLHNNKLTHFCVFGSDVIVAEWDIVPFPYAAYPISFSPIYNHLSKPVGFRSDVIVSVIIYQFDSRYYPVDVTSFRTYRLPCW